MSRDDRGQVTILAIGLAMVVFAIAGLAVDGTRVFLVRRSLQNSADAAALAGAAELDTDAYYASGGNTLVLDQAAARRAASDWLARRDLPVEAQIATAPRRVEVLIRAETPTSFLGIVGVLTIPVAAAASAAPLPGAP
jgi:Putative Flp pilus-assembly TadE/G-like